jgi:hypothetical protein
MSSHPLRRNRYRSIPMEQHLLEAVSDGVATLTLNRPERLNALSTPIMEGLLEALPRLSNTNGGPTARKGDLPQAGPPGRTDPPPSAQAKARAITCEPRSRATARRAAR